MGYSRRASICRGIWVFGVNFPKAHEVIWWKLCQFGSEQGSFEGSNSWPPTFSLLEKGGRRHEATEHNRNPSSTFFFELQNSQWIFSKMPSICVGNLFENVTLQCFMVGRSSPENLCHQKQTLWIFSEKPLVSKTAKV